MLRTLIGMELKRYFRNPIYYIGAVVVFISVYGNVSGYLGIHYFTKESEIPTLEQHSELSDGDIMDGYIPTSREEQYALGIAEIGKTMMNKDAFGMSREETEELINRLKESNMSIMEIAEYMKENYSFNSVQYLFYDAKLKKASVEEANEYIRNSLEKGRFTEYFSRKFSDYLGVHIIFYAILIFAFLFIWDTRRDIYELLHTKPMKGRQYILGKLLGGMAAMSAAVIVITLIFDVLVIFHGKANGFPVSFWDIWQGIILYIFPNLFMVASVYTGISIFFKNPLPAIPLLVLYMIYSNMGSVLADGSFGYKVRKLAILVRFPDVFFETVTPAQAVINQVFLLLCGGVITAGSILVWRRRRVY